MAAGRTSFGFPVATGALMLLNHSTLMLAIAFSGAAISITLIASWLSSRSENFLLTWAIGAIFVVGAAWGFSHYTQFREPWIVLGAMSCLIIGLGTGFGAGRHFRTRRFPFRLTLAAIAAALIPMNTAFLLGYDGTGLMLANVFSGLLLFATSREYWPARREAPLQIGVLMLLYSVVGVTFLLCAILIGRDTPLYLDGAPQNWAEDLNAIVSIIAITGVGAISLSIHQSRVALRHRLDARTDPLTGLKNRRAVFDLHGELDRNTAVVLFDIDRFKAINDRHGHEAGDQVLQRFADVMRENCRAADSAARLGGEEFALVMPRSQTELAMTTAENIRTLFAQNAFAAKGETFSCTVSAGIAIAQEPQRLNDMLRHADIALYAAKRDGRDCVRLADIHDAVTSADVVHLPVRTSGTGAR